MAEPNEDLSMEDILSSIRNILTEDNAAQQSVAQADVVTSKTDFQPQEESTVDVASLINETIDVSASATDNQFLEEEDDDEVFVLSPAMMVGEDSVVSDFVPQDNHGISEADIMDFSHLADGLSEEVAVQEDSVVSLENESDMYVAPTEERVEINAPLASEVLAESNEAYVADISDDDILNLSSMIEQESAAVESVSETPVETEWNVQDDMALAELSNVEETVSIPSLDSLDLPQIDVDADPIFEPEGTVTTEIDPNQIMESLTATEVIGTPDVSVEESVIDDAALNEILDFHAQVEETKPVEVEQAAYATTVFEPEAEGVTQTEDIQDVMPEAVENVVQEVAVQGPEETVPEKTDAADISANIINNFAKMFAAKKAAETVMPEVDSAAVASVSPSISELVRDAVVNQVARQVETNFESYAREAVAAQTQAWLDANLPAIVEAVVSKEIERVMAKVGS